MLLLASSACGHFLCSEAPEHLLSISRENTQLLINQLFSLPREQKADGAYFSLPAPTTIVPREKPLPKEKPKTRWEKFAEQKGIEKKKRGRLVWDEATQQWAPRYGYKSVTDQAAAVPWIEAKPGDGMRLLMRVSHPLSCLPPFQS